MVRHMVSICALFCLSTLSLVKGVVLFDRERSDGLETRVVIEQAPSHQRLYDAQPYNSDKVSVAVKNFHHDAANKKNATALYAYLFSHFTTTDEQVYWHLSDGDDPLNFSPLYHAKPILRSNIGAKAARDPFLAHNPVDEMYYLIGNNQSLIRDKLTYDQAFNQGYKGIVVWEAKNDLLTSWSQPRLLDVAQNDSLHVFAPEAVWLPDRQLFLIHWSGATKSDPVQRIYGAFTKDFKKVGKPFLYHTQGNTGVGDLTLFKLDTKPNSWVRFFRSDVNGYQVRGEISDNGAFGHWKPIAPLNLSAPLSIDPTKSNQAPLIYKTNNPHKSEFIIWIKGGAYQAYETENIRILPYTQKTAPYFPQDAEQGHVLPLTKKQYNAVKAKYYNSG